MQHKKKDDEKKKEDKERGNIYDKILKENIDTFFLPLVEKHLHFKIVEVKMLEAKLQSTIEREVDFLRKVKTDTGEEFILHIEFQAENETDMIYRVKEYDAIIQRKYKNKDEDKNKNKHLDIRHYVIFLGKGKMTMQTQLEERHIFRHFEVLNLNELDFNQMIQSQIPEALVFAILSDFKGKDPEKVIRLIVEKLVQCSPHQSKLKKFIKQLKVLSNLRTLEEDFIKTIEDMPVTYNLEDSYTYKMGMEKGMKKGMEKGMKKGREEKRELAKKKDLELEKQQRKSITAMLVLGITAEQIAKHLEVPIELVEKIQQELN